MTSFKSEGMAGLTTPHQFTNCPFGFNLSTLNTISIYQQSVQFQFQFVSFYECDIEDQRHFRVENQWMKVLDVISGSY